MARDLKLEVVLAAIDKATKPIRGIMDSSGSLAKSLKETRDTLKGLQSQQKDISSFRTLKEASRKSGDELKQQQDKVRELARQMGSTETASKGLRDEFDAAARKARSLKTKHGEHRTSLQKLRDKLRETGVSTSNLGEHERQLKTKINETNTAITNQGTKLKRLTGQHRRYHQELGNLRGSQQFAGSMAGVGMRGMAVGGAGLLGASRMLAPGISYGEQMSELQAVTRLGKDDDQMTMLKDQARALGASTAFSATEVGGGQTFLARAGFTPEAISASMGDILNLALANGTDLARTADIASNISSAFKIDPETEGNITRVADVLSGTAARANVNLESLGDTMKYLGGAEDLNLTLEQAATMAGLMGNIGIQGSQAGTAMRAMMNRLTGPAKKGRDAMESLSLQVADSNGKMRDMPDILRDLNSATKDMGNVQRKALLTDIFGAEAGSGMAELVGQMSDGGLDDLLDQLHKVAGENARMAATRADNIGGDLKGLKSAWEEIGISISDTNEGPLRNLITSLTGVVRGVGEWMQENPELAGTIAKIVGYTLAFVAAMGALTFVLASLIGPLAMIKFAMVTFAGATWAATWPILAVIAAIALLGVAAWMLWRNWDGVVGGLKALWADMVAVAHSAFNALLTFFTGIWSEIKAAFDGGILGVSALIINWSPLGLFYKAFAGVMGYFGVDLPGKFTEFGGMLMSGLVTGIKNGLGAVKNAVTGAGDQAIGWFKDKLGIRSPSRVFAALGDDTMAGLQAGLDRSQDGPLASILKAGKAMAGAGALALGIGGAGQALAVDGRPPLQSGSAPVVVQGDTITIQLTAPAGTDSAELERMINRVMDQRERGKAARIRSALYDNE